MTWTAARFDGRKVAQTVIMIALGFVAGYAMIGAGTLYVPAIGPISGTTIGAAAVMGGGFLLVARKKMGQSGSDDCDCC